MVWHEPFPGDSAHGLDRRTVTNGFDQMVE
jgi:hypothetical protein